MLYSITRHNLFDVDVYIKRAVVVGSTYFALQMVMNAATLRRW